MIAMVAEHGTRHWTLIGSMLEGRTGKQVHGNSYLLHLVYSKYIWILSICRK